MKREMLKGPQQTSSLVASSKTPRSNAPVLLALEPLEGKVRRVKTMWKACRLWDKTSEVIPVSYVAPVDLGWPVGFSTLGKKDVVDLADKRMLPALRKFDRKLFLNAEILSGSLASKREAIESVLIFAKHENAQLIVVGTHGRRGFSRFRLGSFAEQLISTSPTPVMVVHDKTKVPANVKRIFFPSDLSSTSKKTFKYVLSVAQRLGARVTLFHAVEIPSLMTSPVPGADARMISELMRQAEVEQRKTGSAWVAYATKRGVHCDLAWGRKVDYLGSIILRNLKMAKGDLALIESKYGPFGQTFFGADIRDVLCGSPVPVVVVKPPARRKERR
ncbi:MAG: universal stress protein [Bdellovibrionales bacterium]